MYIKNCKKHFIWSLAIAVIVNSWWHRTYNGGVDFNGRRHKKLQQTKKTKAKKA